MTTQPWHRNSKPARSIVPLSRFVSDTVFALKNRGYGCLFALAGIDDEGLTDQSVADAVARVSAALQAIPQDSRLYQYVRIRKGYELPRKERYANATVEAFVGDRIGFLNRTAHFHRVELFWCLTIEPPPRQTIRKTPEQHAAETTRAISELQKAAEILTSQLGNLLGIRLLAKNEAASFFSYLLNLEEWSLERRLTADDHVDRQLATSSVTWHHDHLRVGKQFVQMFSLVDSPAGSRPNLFGALQAIDANMIACATWVPVPRTDVQKRVGQIEGFIGFFRHKFLALAANLHSPENLQQAVGAKTAEKATGKLDDILDSMDNEGHHYGRYSFSLLVHSRDQAEVLEVTPQIHRALVEAQAPYVEETLGNLAAYYALLPGNSSGDAASNFNVRQFWLRGDHHADLALIFAPYGGSTFSNDLEDEYLNVYETRTGTPFFLDPYVDGMRTTLVLGAPRTGKSVNGNQIIAFEQKYGGYTYAIDVGGSFDSTIGLYGGTVEKVGVGNPRINPFLLAPTEDNINFLFGFIRLLLTSGGAQLSPEDEEAIDKAVRRMYLVPENVRRLRFLLLPPHLQRYLAKWIEGGVYGKTFDNVEDSLRLARIQCFDFEAITDSQQDLIEPLLFWILRQINTVMHDPNNLGVPKHILFDELWKHLKTRQLLEMALDALKTGGKHLVGATLLTQSAKDLGVNADLIVNACTTFLFLRDPSFNRDSYQKLFNLNDQEVFNLASLRPREALLKRADFSKIIQLNLDPKSYWLFSTKPKDKVRRLKAIEQFGYEQAFERLRIEQTA